MTDLQKSLVGSKEIDSAESRGGQVGILAPDAIGIWAHLNVQKTVFYTQHTSVH